MTLSLDYGTKLRTVHTTAVDGMTVPMGSTVELTFDMVLWYSTETLPNT